jgi:hypothetical protein
MLLIVNSVLPDLDFALLQQKIEETFEKPVVGMFAGHEGS